MLLPEVAGKVRGVCIPDRSSHFLDLEAGVLEQIFCSGHADRPKESLEPFARVPFENMLEAGWAEVEPRGQVLHQLWFLEFACDSLQRGADPGVHGGPTAPGTTTQGR
jgi:hypothetical protein